MITRLLSDLHPDHDVLEASFAAVIDRALCNGRDAGVIALSALSVATLAASAFSVDLDLLRSEATSLISKRNVAAQTLADAFYEVAEGGAQYVDEIAEVDRMLRKFVGRSEGGTTLADIRADRIRAIAAKAREYGDAIDGADRGPDEPGTSTAGL